MITNYGGKLSACIKACREGGRVRAAFMKREEREGLRSEKGIGYDLKIQTFTFIFVPKPNPSRPFLIIQVFYFLQISQLII